MLLELSPKTTTLNSTPTLTKFFSCHWSRDLPSSPTSVTVIKDCANRYFLSFVVEVEPESPSLRTGTIAKNQSIGIDLGIKTFAVMSNGEKVESPDYSRLDKRIRKLQKKRLLRA
ncbi:MAG: transposase [Gloeotrichia echinulata DEX184]